LGFAEDYKKVLLNCKHELVLMLTKNLGDVFEQTRNEQIFKLEMTSITVTQLKEPKGNGDMQAAKL